MPAQHNHNDRGALHEGCAACAVVAEMMTEAGVSPAQVFDYRVSPEGVGGTYSPSLLRQQDVHIHDAQIHAYANLRPKRDQIAMEWNEDDRPDLDTRGQEMGNKASVAQDETETVEMNWLDSLLGRARSVTLPYGAATQTGHVYLEHDRFMVPLDLSLGQVQEVHASLHHMGIGHSDNADHFVAEFPREALKSRHRLLEQKHWSALGKGLKAEQHRRREQAARESREQVIVESARALKRAIEHTKGTVVPRARFEAVKSGEVSVKVGVKDRVTIATATIGNDTAVGVAICHPTDRFDPETGRQLALARALVALGSVHELEWMTKVEERNR